MLMLAVIAVVRAIQFTVKYCFVFVDCFVVNGRFYEYCEGKTELLCSESADCEGDGIRSEPCVAPTKIES